MPDSLGDRLKKYEKTFSPTYPIRLPLIIRLDGVHFHTNVKKWKCKKPFDERLIEAMFFTAKTLCENISGAQVAYVQSDEITILIRDDMDIHSQPWYDKKINKIISVSAAKASNAFNYKFRDLDGNKYVDDCDYPVTIPPQLNKMAEFDCRGFVVPEYEIQNSFIWRQQDCTRNSVQMLARAFFSHKELDKKNNSEIQDMLMLQKGVNWNDIDTHLKRGACVIKKEIVKQTPVRDDKGKIVPGEYEGTLRSSWIVDKEIPIFTKDKNYINKFANLGEK